MLAGMGGDITARSLIDHSATRLLCLKAIDRCGDMGEGATANGRPPPLPPSLPPSPLPGIDRGRSTTSPDGVATPPGFIRS